MSFFFLRYLFLFQRYSSFPIMQNWSLMTSSVVQVQWCDTKLRTSPPIMKQCYWNLAGMLHLTKYTGWFTFWCCYGNMIGSSLLPLKIKFFGSYALYQQFFILFSVCLPWMLKLPKNNQHRWTCVALIGKPRTWIASWMLEFTWWSFDTMWSHDYWNMSLFWVLVSVEKKASWETTFSHFQSNVRHNTEP